MLSGRLGLAGGINFIPSKQFPFRQVSLSYQRTFASWIDSPLETSSLDIFRQRKSKLRMIFSHLIFSEARVTLVKVGFGYLAIDILIV